MENKLKHLEFIQMVISRLSNNSFYVKGWAITIISIIISLNNVSFSFNLLLFCNFVIFIFWLLDSYFIYQERKFRLLYDEVRYEGDIDFRMVPTEFKGKFLKIVMAFFSGTLMVYYPLIMLLSFILFKINYD